MRNPLYRYARNAAVAACVAVLTLTGVSTSPAFAATTPEAPAGSAITTSVYAQANGSQALQQNLYTNFEYQVNVGCGASTCEDVTVTIPLTGPMLDEQGQPRDDWTYTAEGKIGTPVTGKVVGTNYVVTFDDPIPAGESTGFKLSVLPGRKTTPLNAQWDLTESTTGTVAGKQVTAQAPEPVHTTTRSRFLLNGGKSMSVRPTKLPDGRTVNTRDTVYVGTDGLIDLRWRFDDFTGPGVNDTVSVDPNQPVTFVDQLPEGWTYRADLSTPTVVIGLQNRRPTVKMDPPPAVTYDDATRTLTITVEHPPVYYDLLSETWWEVQGLVLQAKDAAEAKATDEGFRETNVAKVTASPLGGEPQTSNKSASVILRTETPIDVTRKDLSSNRYNESADTGLSNYTLHTDPDRRNPLAQTTRIVDPMPCFDNPTSNPNGFTSTEPDEICANPVLNVRKVGVDYSAWGAVDGNDDPINVKVTYADGTSEVLSLSKQTRELPVPRTDVAQVEFTQTTPAATNALVRIYFTIPNDPRLPKGTRIRNQAASAIAAPDAPLPEPQRRASLDRSFDLLASDPIALVGAPQVKGTISATGDAKVDYRIQIGWNISPTHPNKAKRHWVVLFPPADQLNIDTDVLKQAGYTVIDNYQGTGKRGIEYIGDNPGDRSIPIQVHGLTQGGVYPVEVYSAVDGSPLDDCRDRLQNNRSVGTSFVDWWPGQPNEQVCFRPGSIILTGAVDAFAAQLKIRDIPEGSNATPGEFVQPTKPVDSMTGNVEYSLEVTNIGPGPLKNITFIDVLPRVGDTYSKTGTARGSQAKGVLRAKPTVPAGFTVLYSTATTPCQDEVSDVINSDAGGCDNGWSATAPGDLSTVTALKFVQQAGQTLQSAATVRAVVPLKFVGGTGQDVVAQNSMSATAGTASGATLEPAESPRLGFRVATALLSVNTVLDIQYGAPGTVANYSTRATRIGADADEPTLDPFTGENAEPQQIRLGEWNLARDFSGEGTNPLYLKTVTCVDSNGAPVAITASDTNAADTGDRTLTLGAKYVNTTITCTYTLADLPGTVTWHKIDEGGNPLKGAKFKLQLKGDNGEYADAADLTDIADCDADEATACVGPDKDPAPGAFTVTDLNWGEYRIVETAAPAGYKLTSEQPEFTIDATQMNAAAITAKTMTFAAAGDGIVNELQEPLVLPLTGGASTDGFVILAVVLLGGAVAIVLVRGYRRQRSA